MAVRLVGGGLQSYAPSATVSESLGGVRKNSSAKKIGGRASSSSNNKQSSLENVTPSASKEVKQDENIIILDKETQVQTPQEFRQRPQFGTTTNIQPSLNVQRVSGNLELGKPSTIEARKPTTVYVQPLKESVKQAFGKVKKGDFAGAVESLELSELPKASRYSAEDFVGAVESLGLSELPKASRYSAEEIARGVGKARGSLSAKETALRAGNIAGGISLKEIARGVGKIISGKSDKAIKLEEQQKKIYQEMNSLDNENYNLIKKAESDIRNKVQSGQSYDKEIENYNKIYTESQNKIQEKRDELNKIESQLYSRTGTTKKVISGVETGVVIGASSLAPEVFAPYSIIKGAVEGSKARTKTEQALALLDIGFGLGLTAGKIVQTEKDIVSGEIKQSLKNLEAQPFKIDNFYKVGKDNKIRYVAEGSREVGKVKQTVEVVGLGKEMPKNELIKILNKNAKQPYLINLKDTQTISADVYLKKSKITGEIGWKTLGGYNKDGIKFASGEISKGISIASSQPSIRKKDYIESISLIKEKPLASVQGVFTSDKDISKTLSQSLKVGGETSLSVSKSVTKEVPPISEMFSRQFKSAGFSVSDKSMSKSPSFSNIYEMKDVSNIDKISSSIPKQSIKISNKGNEIINLGVGIKNIQESIPKQSIKISNKGNEIINLGVGIKNIQESIPKQINKETTLLPKISMTKSQVGKVLQEKQQSGLNMKKTNLNSMSLSLDKVSLQSNMNMREFDKTMLKSKKSLTPKSITSSIKPINANIPFLPLAPLPSIFPSMIEGAKGYNFLGVSGKISRKYKPKYTASLISASGIGSPIELTEKQIKKLQSNEFLGIETRPLIKIKKSKNI